MLSPREIFVIDAHGFLHRNYHALPKLTTSKGEEVGALYGFVNWLIRFIREKKPTHMAVCFDSKGPTFRHKMYEQYKANRPPTEEALVSQLKIAREAVTALGLKTVALAGAEADDIMATVAAMAQKLAERIKQGGFGHVRIEGLPAADWVLVDAGDVVVHLFRPEVRTFYNLERMLAFGDSGNA
jgi:5'-3' exonuclease